MYNAPRVHEFHHDQFQYINQQFNVNENLSFRKTYDTVVVVVVDIVNDAAVQYYSFNEHSFNRYVCCSQRKSENLYAFHGEE